MKGLSSFWCNIYTRCPATHLKPTWTPKTWRLSGRPISSSQKKWMGITRCNWTCSTALHYKPTYPSFWSPTPTQSLMTSSRHSSASPITSRILQRPIDPSVFAIATTAADLSCCHLKRPKTNIDRLVQPTCPSTILSLRYQSKLNAPFAFHVITSSFYFFVIQR